MASLSNTLKRGARDLLARLTPSELVKSTTLPSDAARDLPRPRDLSRAGCWLEPGPEVPPELLERALEADAAPVPSVAQREGYHPGRSFDYWLSGLIDAAAVARLRARWAGAAEGGTVLDLGGASGRVARHFAVTLADHRALLCDIDSRHVDWVARRLGPRGVDAFQNTILPHLPLADASVALVTAFSVFTHLDRFESAWLYELRRILAPGGVAVVTVHTERTWAALEPRMELWRSFGSSRWEVDGVPTRSRPVADGMPGDHVVARWQRHGPYRSNVFHSVRHLRERWGRVLEVADVVHEWSGYQDAVVLVKR